MTKVKEEIKAVLQEKMHRQIDDQIESFTQALASIEESKRNETKSSAGDKFETGRAMMQREQDKVQSQVEQLKATKTQLKQLSPDQKCTQGVLGAIIYTDKGNFYISVSLGKIMVDEVQYYAISPDAPLFRFMVGKKMGDDFKFRDRAYQILDIT